MKSPTRASHQRTGARGIALLGVVLLALLVTTYWLATRQQIRAIEGQAIQSAAVYTHVLEEFRTLYTSEVVSIIGESGGNDIQVSHRYRDIDGGIPLPATLSMELGRRITSAGDSKVSLYSPHPFPWRTDGGLTDQFAANAWKHLNQTPDKPYYEFAQVHGTRSLRYAVADRLRPECVHCHNNHPQTPRDGWKPGDVRGVLEVSIPVPTYTEAEQINAFWLITPGFGIAAFILFAFFRRLQRNALILEDEVEERTTELADRMHRYELLFATSPSGIAVMSAEGLCKIWNPAFERMFHQGTPALGEFFLLDIVHPDDKTRLERMLSELKASPDHDLRTELRFVTDHGHTLWGRTSARILREEERPDVTEVFLMVEDITTQKDAETILLDHRDRLEREVMIQTAELRASNQELESFCRSVSHDLRAPLRALDGFSLALVEDCGDQLDDKGRDFLHRIRAGSQRMAMLIDQMLGLSRMGLMDLEYEEVDLSALAKELLAELKAGNPDRSVQCSISEGLTAQGDPRLLSLALQNLLGNAWKFTRNTANAQITFTQEMREGTPVFLVRDNGIGFEMSNADALFAPFHRLPESAEFEGEGVGLATVARVIARHGGHLQAESQPGKGATFFFTLQGHSNGSSSVPQTSRDPQ